MSWQKVQICDLGKVVTGDTPPKTKPEFYGSAYPFIKPTDMKIGQRYTYNFEDSYSEEGFKKYRKKLIPAGATGVVTIGSIGQKLTLLHTPCFVNQAVNAVIPDPRKFDSMYVYYLLRHNIHLVKSADTGASSGRENVSKSIFSGLEVIATLDKNEQQRIAAVFNPYDCLIENNQRRIKLLEEAALRLYREWFVALRFPGHERVKVVDGVPQGWERLPIAASLSYLNRGIAPQYDDNAPGLVINQKCIRHGCLDLTPARHQAKEVRGEKLLQIGDVLINSTGTGTLGRVAQVRSPVVNCTVDTHVTIARPTNQAALAFWGVALLEMEARFSEMGIGATNQQELIRAHVGAIESLVPPAKLQTDFHARAWPIFLQSDKLGQQSEILKQARDALLPRLMSGALAV